MNMFTVQILQMLIKNGKVEIQEVLKQLNLTRRMALYYQKQLNDFLLAMELGQTEIREEILYLETTDVQKIISTMEELDLCYYYPEAKERQECILIKIGISKRPQFLEGFVEEFHVSRRTLTNDLICLKEYLQEYGIQLLSKQKQGYYLEGDELTIRYLLLSAYHHRDNICIDHIKKGFLLETYQDYCSEKISDSVFEQIRQILLKSETYCKEKFVYFSLPDLAQSILMICLRGKKNNIELQAEEEQTFAATIDYVEKELEKLGLKLDEKERQYFGMVLQSAKISNCENGYFEESIERLIEDIITEFKRVSGLNLLRSMELFAMFKIHVRSMYYRTKYRIKITDFFDEASDIDRTFFYWTKQVMEKVGEKYGLLLDDGEIQFMSYYFFCMSRQNETLSPEIKEKIVIVCVSGLGSSVYIRYQVSKLLERSFAVVISDLRNLEKVLDQNTRLIISTLDIAREYCKGIRVIKVSTILSPQNKKELIDWLLHEDVYIRNNGMVSDVIDIIKEHAVIQEQEKLFLRLNNYFQTEHLWEKELGLADLLCPEYIQIIEKAESWKDGLQKASAPLLKAEVIHESYVMDMKAVIQEYGPYCEFLNGMLLAHAESKNNVIRPVISLAVFRNPIIVKEWEKEISAIFVLGIVEQASHAAALSELVTNLSMNEKYKSLHKLGSTDEIYKALLEDTKENFRSKRRQMADEKMDKKTMDKTSENGV